MSLSQNIRWGAIKERHPVSPVASTCMQCVYTYTKYIEHTHTYTLTDVTERDQGQETDPKDVPQSASSSS